MIISGRLVAPRGPIVFCRSCSPLSRLLSPPLNPELTTRVPRTPKSLHRHPNSPLHPHCTTRHACTLSEIPPCRIVQDPHSTPTPNVCQLSILVGKVNPYSTEAWFPLLREWKSWKLLWEQFLPRQKSWLFWGWGVEVETWSLNVLVLALTEHRMMMKDMQWAQTEDISPEETKGGCVKGRFWRIYPCSGFCPGISKIITFFFCARVALKCRGRLSGGSFGTGNIRQNYAFANQSFFLFANPRTSRQRLCQSRHTYIHVRAPPIGSLKWGRPYRGSRQIRTSKKGGWVKGCSRHEGFGVFEVKLLEPVISNFWNTAPIFVHEVSPDWLSHSGGILSHQNSSLSAPMASVRRPESINAALRRNASVRRPEPSHGHTMLAPMVSVPPDWGHRSQHRVARWWLRPPYLGFHLWSWALWALVALVVVWAWSVVPNLAEIPVWGLNWNRQTRQVLHSHTAKCATKHE